MKKLNLMLYVTYNETLTDPVCLLKLFNVLLDRGIEARELQAQDGVIRVDPRGFRYRLEAETPPAEY